MCTFSCWRIDNCAYCDSYGCIQCETGYDLRESDGLCYNTEEICKDISDCAECDANGCIECDEGYELNENFSCDMYGDDAGWR